MSSTLQELEQRIPGSQDELKASPRSFTSFRYFVVPALRVRVRAMTGWSQALVENLLKRAERFVQLSHQFLLAERSL